MKVTFYGGTGSVTGANFWWSIRMQAENLSKSSLIAA